MKKTYNIEVDCANCANLMEEAAGKTEGVTSAVVNFMTQKMIVEFAEGGRERHHEGGGEGVQKGGAGLRDRAVKAPAPVSVQGADTYRNHTCTKG